MKLFKGQHLDPEVYQAIVDTLREQLGHSALVVRNPFDNPGKRTVRESWNTPILRFLNSEYGFRYRYMGLPGIELSGPAIVA